MESVRRLISDNLKRYNDFDYYFIAIDKAASNLQPNPDICIECCKSLIEGLSKVILKTLDPTYDPKDINKDDFSPLAKKSHEKIG